MKTIVNCRTQYHFETDPPLIFAWTLELEESDKNTKFLRPNKVEVSAPNDEELPEIINRHYLNALKGLRLRLDFSESGTLSAVSVVESGGMIDLRLVNNLSAFSKYYCMRFAAEKFSKNRTPWKVSEDFLYGDQKSKWEYVLSIEDIVDSVYFIKMLGKAYTLNRQEPLDNFNFHAIIKYSLNKGVVGINMQSDSQESPTGPRVFSSVEFGP